jgi:hypothetical protein
VLRQLLISGIQLGHRRGVGHSPENRRQPPAACSCSASAVHTVQNSFQHGIPCLPPYRAQRCVVLSSPVSGKTHAAVQRSTAHQ